MSKKVTVLERKKKRKRFTNGKFIRQGENLPDQTPSGQRIVGMAGFFAADNMRNLVGQHCTSTRPFNKLHPRILKCEKRRRRKKIKIFFRNPGK